MPISLTQSQIDAALPLVAKGLDQYLWLKANVRVNDVCSNAEFRRRFNHFYRVRRNAKWRLAFYDLLECSIGKPVDFREILCALHGATGCYEASFASKLLATVNPDMPVIDSIVLCNLQLRLPAAHAKDRVNRIQKLHAELLSEFGAYLATENGRTLVSRFRAAYPQAKITEIKMVDFVLWQTRPTTTS